MTTPEPDDNLPLPEDEVTISQALILAILGAHPQSDAMRFSSALAKALSLVKMSAKEKACCASWRRLYIGRSFVFWRDCRNLDCA